MGWGPGRRVWLGWLVWVAASAGPGAAVGSISVGMLSPMRGGLPESCELQRLQVGLVDLWSARQSLFAQNTL